jgi:hypothetical protein
VGSSLTERVGGLSATAGGTLLDERGRGAVITGGSDGVGVRAVLTGGRDVVDFGGMLAGAGGRDGFGGGLRREGRDVVGFGNTLAGFGSTLAGAGGRDVVGLGARPTMLDFGTVLAGAGVGTAAVTGTLADSGMSSQPASMSSAELAAFLVPCREPPSATEAISLGTRSGCWRISQNRRSVRGDSRLNL